MKKFVIFLALVLFCVGCFDDLKNGTVVKKSFTKAHITQETDYILVGQVLVPSKRTVEYPDEWWLKLKWKDQWSWIKVSEKTYNIAEVGDYVDLEPKRK